MGAWVASLFSYGLVLKPRLTRLLGTMFTVEAISDYLQLAYEAAKKQEK